MGDVRSLHGWHMLPRAESHSHKAPRFEDHHIQLFATAIQLYLLKTKKLLIETVPGQPRDSRFSCRHAMGQKRPELAQGWLLVPQQRHQWNRELRHGLVQQVLVEVA